MLYDKIDQLILDAMKARDEKKKKVLREIKAELVAWHNSKENYLRKAEYTEEVELKILKDMCTKCQENAAVYANRIHKAEDAVKAAEQECESAIANRQAAEKAEDTLKAAQLREQAAETKRAKAKAVELHEREMFREEVDRVSVLQEYIPQPATYSEIIEAFDKIEDIEKTPKSMGLIIKRLKETVKNAEGGMVAEVVKWRLGLSKNSPLDAVGGC